MTTKVDLSKYDNSWYNPGNPFKRGLWYMTNACFFICPLLPFSGLKVFWLKSFGARVGRGVVIKPGVNIKYPWNLTIGNHTWIGERVWIDNLGKVQIGSNCCLSQGSMLLCGNHNYKKPTFDLMVKGIVLEDGVWIGAHAMVTPGVICKSHSVLAVKSVAVHNLEPYCIYRGNPATKVRERNMEA